MSHTYCPPFTVVVAHLVLILFSLGMIANMLRTLYTGGPVSPMAYFFILAFVTVSILSGLMLGHMLFVKRVIIPPPCLT